MLHNLLEKPPSRDNIKVLGNMTTHTDVGETDVDKSEVGMMSK